MPITPLIENQMVVRKALHEPVSVRNRTSFRTARREIGKVARRDRRPKPAPHLEGRERTGLGYA
jgi:hypothetical protein